MLSIGEFSRHGKVTAKALRYYDEIGLLRPAHVSRETGYRYYDVGQLKTLALIGRLKAYHFTLDEIAAVLAQPGDSGRMASLIHQKQRLLEGRVEEYRLILDQLQQDARNLERGIDIMSEYDNIPVKLAEVPPQIVLSLRRTINLKNEYGVLMARLYETLEKEKLTPLGPPMSIFHGEEFDPEHYDMEIAVPVKEVGPGTRAFPGGLCAMATLEGPYTGLVAMYANIMHWIEGEGYSLNGDAFEIYCTDPNETPPEQNVTEIYFPVKK